MASARIRPRRAGRPLLLALLLALLGSGTGPGLLAGQSAPGPGPMVTDRPDFTESATTVAPGFLQLEAGYTFTRSGETRQHDVGEALLRVGVRDRIEIRLGIPGYGSVRTGTGDEDGFGDASVGLKVRLFEPSGAGAPRTAFLVGTSLPTGADDIGASGLQPGATLALAWDLPGGLGLGVNLGYESVEEEGGDLGRGKGSVALGVPVSGPVGAFLEGYVLVPEGSRDAESFLDGGLTVLLGPHLQLDARVGAGLEGPDPDYFAGAGLAVRW